MTAVMRLKINNWPIILGDLLTSGPEQPGSRTMIPTTEYVDQEELIQILPRGTGEVPVGLRQKIAIISDNLVVGWAGSYIAARQVITELYAKSKIEQFTIDSLSDYFGSIGGDIGGQTVNFVGFITDPLDPDGITSFEYGCETESTTDFGEVGLLGTGSEDLRSLLNQFPEPPRMLAGNPNAAGKAISFALVLSGILLNTELATLQSLLSFYGGGYEIASFIDGRFQKVDHITYVFWRARTFEQEVRISQVPLHVFSYGYSGDILRIRSVSFDETPDRVSTRQSGYAVTPMTRAVPKAELAALQVPELNNKWLCHYFFVHSDSDRVQIYAQVESGSTAEIHVRFQEEDDKLLVVVEEDFIKSVMIKIFRRYQS